MLSMTPSEELKEVTIREVFDALKLDGFQHLRGQWMAEDIEGVVTGGCVLQQGGMNLGVEVEDENEEDRNTLFAQLNRWKIRPGSKWDKDEYGSSLPKSDRGLGSIIVHWNDMKVYENKRTLKRVWALPTYKEVIDMAEGVLRPHMDKTVKLRTRTWNFKRLESSVV